MIVTRQIMRAMSLTAMSVTVISCASSSHEIAAEYVSPTKYAAFNCDQLSLELARLNSRKAELAASIDKKASSDESMTAVSAILFWPAAFALGGNEAQESEYARLKGEYDAVQKAGVEKTCKLDPNKKAKSPLIANYPADNPGNSSVLEFYGEAEEEVDSDNIDKNTWARALVEAEGDEAKRKAKYIELRANELYMQNGGSLSTVSINRQSTVSAGSSNFDLSGAYVSDRIDTNWALKNKAILRIKLNQNLGSVEGEFFKSLNGPIRGTIVGDQVDVTWEAGNCNSGEGTLSVDPDGSTLTGFLLCRSQGMRKYDIVFRKI